MTYDILATGSSGNAVVINGEILIDCGVPMKKLRESGYIKSLNLVLLTHAHGAGTPQGASRPAVGVL